MDSSSSSSSSSSQALYTGASSPRSKELQGPRPTPLRVRKDSHKVKKPPIPPPPSHFSQPNTTTTNNTSFQQQQHRTTPLIIYTISPKVIHTNPEDFMTLVQRLTSADNTQGASSTPISGGGLISPAARYAVMDKINTYQQTLNSTGGGCTQDDIILGPSSSSSVDHLERATSNMQFVPSGILSPGPASLAPNNFLFSPLSSDPNSMSNFFQGLSPMMNHNQQVITNNKEIINFNGISSIPSPGTNNLFLSPSIIFSPTIYSLDLFNNFGDHL